MVKNVSESTKNNPCPLCKRTDFNYQAYGEYYCNNPEHSPRRVRKRLVDKKEENH